MSLLLAALAGGPVVAVTLTDPQGQPFKQARLQGARTFSVLDGRH